MSNIVIYNPTAVVVNQVTQYLLSVNTPEYDSVTYKVINPDISTLLDVPIKWWKVSGDSVIEMNSTEKDTIDTSLLPAAKTDKKLSLQQDATFLYENQGYSLEIRQNINTLYTNSIRILPNRSLYLQSLIDWFHLVENEVKIKQALVDVQTTLSGIAAIYLDEATLITADPHKTISGALSVIDTEDLSAFLNGNAEVTDSNTGIKGPFYLMQELEMRKDLYNDTENPIYIEGHTPILGVSGILQDHADRVLNIETIHQKMGWHEQQIYKTINKKPKDVLIYYGYLNSFNSSVNGWDNEKVAQDISKYDILVFGDTIESPTHPDYANTQIIIPRIKALNPNALIFGYVALPSVTFNTSVDQWNTLSVHGIFIDEAGYDYGKTRAQFITAVDYIHGKTNSNLCFVNAWNTDHVLGTANDVYFPNSTYNSGLVESNLTLNDWILLESFPVNTTAYSGNDGYESKSDWLVRGIKILSLRTTYGVNFAASCIINNANINGQNLFNFSYISSLMFSLEGFGSSDTTYGSSSAAVTYWNRINFLGTYYTLYPSVNVSNLDADVYLRYTDFATWLLDFSASAQSSDIMPYNYLCSSVDNATGIGDVVDQFNNLLTNLRTGHIISE